MLTAITRLIELAETEAAHKAALAETEISDAAACAVSDTARTWAQLAAQARSELAALTCRDHPYA